MLVVYILKSVLPRPQNTAVKFGSNALADPDPHYFGKMDPDRICIKVKIWGGGGVDAHKWSPGGSLDQCRRLKQL